MIEYNHLSVEKKWQNFWEKNEIFSIKNGEYSDKKFYALDMFPFPSGAGLHVGHPEGYTATDIICRKKRMEGFQVLHPMGWDAFGLPAENFAIKTGVHPKTSTEKNIANFTRQIKSLGFSYDWNREFSTTDESYYKWTQELFLKLYDKNLLYEDDKPLNWCPSCKVVCANEEVEQGLHERCGNPVVKKALKQWMFKITDYAERLLQDLEDPSLDWPEKIKAMQKNWIGKSTGAEVDFTIENFDKKIKIYTTRPDTLFGATYMVLAPEHFLVDEITTSNNKNDVLKYKEEISAKSDLERTELNKDKTGVFTGSYAINPVNGKKIPIWIADYVMMGYGTGAIMSVPAHDERDKEFAEKYNLQIVEVVCENGKLKNSEFLNDLSIEEAKNKIIKFLEEKKLGILKVNYRLRDWIFTRQRYWGEPIPLVFDKNGKCFGLDDSQLPLILPESVNYKPSDTGESPLSKITDWVNVSGYITDKNKVIICDKESVPENKIYQKFTRETSTMPNWAGSSWYYLRYMDPKNSNEAWSKKSEKQWGMVDLYVGGAEHAVLHLLYARFWHKAFYDLGLVSTKEPFKKLVNQGLILSYAYQRKSGGLVPIDEVKEKVANIETGEKKYFEISTGEELVKIVAKMSKSLKNVVNPDDIIEAYGADTLRMYEMFMGPFEQSKAWDTTALEGMYKFLMKIWRYFNEKEILEMCPNKELIKLSHQTVKKVSKDIDDFKFNTAISQLMIWLNGFQKLDFIPKIAGSKFIRLLSPFAPHLAEELWQKISPEDKTLAFKSWPTYNEEVLVEENITYAIQVNGKLRGELKISKEVSKEKCIEEAKKIEKVNKFLTEGFTNGAKIRKEIFVKNKIIGFVIK
jgi:leucyl-tRNA synthetase